MTRNSKGQFMSKVTRTARMVEDQSFIVTAGLFFVVITFAQVYGF